MKPSVKHIALGVVAAVGVGIGIYCYYQKKDEGERKEEDEGDSAPIVPVAATSNPLVPKDLRALFTKYGQEHVFKFVDAGKVPDEEVKKLVADLQTIDVKLVSELFKATTAASTAAAKAAAGASLEPITDIARTKDASEDETSKWKDAGLEAIARSEIATLVLAGGQGTRLGFPRPKGEYNLGLPSNKVLFELQAERILKVRALAAEASGKDITEVQLPWYIMTSRMTHDDIVNFFTKNKFFGLGEDNVRFFEQGTLPCLTPDGKIILDTATSVARAPDGNGGLYRALHLTGMIADMQTRGIKGIHAFAVDNAVCRVADPFFVGYSVAKGCDICCKVCAKVSPEEKIGVLCRRGGRPAFVEYSDLDSTTAAKRNPDGELTFSAGTICIYYYSIDFLAKTCHPDNLPKEYHLARKKIPYADPKTGETIKSSTLKAPNGIKLESFIFDVCPMSTAIGAFEATREAEFSPVKNPPGTPVDSPDSARSIFYALHKKWVVAAGATIKGTRDDRLEVSSRVSYYGEGLEILDGLAIATPALILTEGETPEDVAAITLLEGVQLAVRKDGLNLYILT